MARLHIDQCCGQEIEFGRTQGSEIYPPTVERCPFGCPVKLDYRDRPERVVLRFHEYRYKPEHPRK